MNGVRNSKWWWWWWWCGGGGGECSYENKGAQEKILHPRRPLKRAARRNTPGAVIHQLAFAFCVANYLPVPDGSSQPSLDVRQVSAIIIACALRMNDINKST